MDINCWIFQRFIANCCCLWNNCTNNIKKRIDNQKTVCLVPNNSLFQIDLKGDID